MKIRPLNHLGRGYRWSATRHGPVHVIYHLAAPDGQIGYASLDCHPDRVVLRNLHVFPQFRARGFGTRMLRAILAAYGALPIQLWVHPEPDDMPVNAAQLTAWYKRFGFAPLPDRPAWLERTPQRPMVEALRAQTAHEPGIVVVPYRWTSDAGGRSHILRPGADALQYSGAPRITLCGRDAADWLDWDLDPEDASCLRCHRIWQRGTKTPDAGVPARSATGDHHAATPYPVVPDNDGGQHDHRNARISEG